MNKCSICGNRLSGIPTKKLVEISKLSKSKKKVSRRFSGNLCHRCLSRLIKASLHKEAPP